MPRPQLPRQPLRALHVCACLIQRPAYVRRFYGGGVFGGTERSWSQASGAGALDVTSDPGRGFGEPNRGWKGLGTTLLQSTLARALGVTRPRTITLPSPGSPPSPHDSALGLPSLAPQAPPHARRLITILGGGAHYSITASPPTPPARIIAVVCLSLRFW